MNAATLEQYIETSNIEGLTALLNHEPALAGSVTSAGVSALMLACYYRKPQVIALLSQYISQLSLFEAAATGRLDVLSRLLAEQPGMVNEFSTDGFTPLGLACYFGQPQVASFLISSGADVNLSSRNGFHVTPLHSAVAANQTEITRLLIEHGANVNVKQQLGVTPLHSAAQNGNVEILIMLLENNAAIDARMEGGKVPADLALEKGFDDIAGILMD
ncbi:ankyrin repeat domain-containing protein [Mucilaginibacter paludis]|uniref:Ankyrin n=1 Tax=Mucilaginibacter paludis DSM 18603 TaxID=714943 RepID=H1YCZ9_9SPHI|nr:ankyrin repeat domain-containing protein [Mucilaginibacter paludis]EHQ25170.1 Ankyrin [Mucilaginibacter paludis DSM 18603]